MTVRRILPKVLFVLYISAIAFLCFAKFNPGVDMSDSWLGIPMDKLVHFTMFLPYPILMFAAFYVPKSRATGNAAGASAAKAASGTAGTAKASGNAAHLIKFTLLVTVLGCALAAATELVQGQLQYRSGDIADFAADNTGILTGLGLTCLWLLKSGKI